MFSVDWTEDAQAELAAIWLRASDRRAVTTAQHRIDRLLASDPFTHGSEIVEELYAIDVPPLRAHFEVSSADRVVTVVSVGELR
jgi:hypothetical protein